MFKLQWTSLLPTFTGSPPHPYVIERRPPTLVLTLSSSSICYWATSTHPCSYTLLHILMLLSDVHPPLFSHFPSHPYVAERCPPTLVLTFSSTSVCLSIHPSIYPSPHTLLHILMLLSDVHPSLFFVPKILSPRHLKTELPTFCGSAAQKRVSRIVENDSSLKFSQMIVQAAKSSHIASLLPINWNLVGVNVAQVAAVWGWKRRGSGKKINIVSLEISKQLAL